MGRSNNSFTEWVNGAHTVGGQNSTSEQCLFIAVLSQAAHDAFSTHVGRLERDAARAFFVNKSSQFKTICELAGREPQYVYEKVRKRILKANGWNLDESMRKTYRQSGRGGKRGRPRKKHLTGNAYYAAMGKKGGRPKLYG